MFNTDCNVIKIVENAEKSLKNVTFQNFRLNVYQFDKFDYGSS